MTTDIQTTTLEGVQVENLLGRLEGTASKNAVLLIAHLDSTANAPGAMDDASGVATILETVRRAAGRASARQQPDSLIHRAGGGLLLRR